MQGVFQMINENDFLRIEKRTMESKLQNFEIELKIMKIDRQLKELDA